MGKQATDTLTDFLLARIAEDEAAARAAVTVGVPRVEHLGGGKWGKEYVKQMDLGDDVTRGVVWSIAPGQSSPGSTGTDKTGTALFERFDPARVLAECEAKRRIVERYLDVKAHIDAGNYDDEYAGELLGLETALEFLTLPYADHPDYREEWRA